MKMIESNQQQREANKVFPRNARTLSRRLCPGEVEILSYITHTGMCRPKWCVFFRRFGLTTGIDLSHFGPGSGMVFEEEYERIWRFRMNKKERVMGKFEKYLKKSFCWRPNLSNNDLNVGIWRTGQYTPTKKSRGGEEGVLGLIFAWCVPLAPRSPYFSIVCSVANYRLHISHL